MLVVDLYTADVLDRTSPGTGIPSPGFSNLKVVVTKGLSSYYRRLGREDFVERMVPHGISAKKLLGGAPHCSATSWPGRRLSPCRSCAYC